MPRRQQFADAGGADALAAGFREIIDDGAQTMFRGVGHEEGGISRAPRAETPVAPHGKAHDLARLRQRIEKSAGREGGQLAGEGQHQQEFRARFLQQGGFLMAIRREQLRLPLRGEESQGV